MHVFSHREQFSDWKDGEERPSALLARRTRTMKLCSSDARSKGQPRPLPLVDVSDLQKRLPVHFLRS
jgi:hypothetical protein